MMPSPPWGGAGAHGEAPRRLQGAPFAAGPCALSRRVRRELHHDGRVSPGRGVAQAGGTGPAQGMHPVNIGREMDKQRESWTDCVDERSGRQQEMTRETACLREAVGLPFVLPCPALADGTAEQKDGNMLWLCNCCCISDMSCADIVAAVVAAGFLLASDNVDSLCWSCSS